MTNVGRPEKESLLVKLKVFLPVGRLRAPVSGDCILPWCPVQCVLHFWTNKMTD